MRVLVIILIVFLAMWSHGGVAGQPSRDILHRIVARCLDSSVPDYCVWCPAPLRGQCALDGGCRRTTEVWAQTDEYVVIGDIKMCGCPADFVHGLAMARTLVSGVEDPKRPAGIWPFAGFYSKDVVLEAAYAAHSGVGQYAFWLGVAAAFLTAFYSWRLIFMTFHGTSRADEHTLAHVHESPKVMTIPLIILSVFAVFVGFVGSPWMHHAFQNFIFFEIM